MFDNWTQSIPPAIEIAPYLLSILSLSCAYLLNNHKVMLGRYIGLLSAVLWGGYGLWVGQWFFLVNHSVFALIYISAIIKFSRKHHSYRRLTEEQRTEIERLKNEIEDFHKQKSQELLNTQRKVIDMATLHRQQLIKGLEALDTIITTVTDSDIHHTRKEQGFSMSFFKTANK